MDGITVLNTYNEAILNSILFLVLGSGFLLFGLFIFNETSGNEKLWSVPVLALAVLFFYCMFVSIVAPVQYAEITVDDSVLFNSVVERYEIESKRGDIYTVIVLDDE